MLGRIGEGWVLSSETCALDIIGAEFVREVEPGEMVICENGKIESFFPFQPVKPRFCIFELVYFSRPDSVIGGASVYETRRRIGAELAKEAPVEADLVCPVPDSGTPAAIGYSQQSGIPYAMGIIRNQYMGRTFIEPTEQIRNMGVRLKLNVNRAVIAGKRIVLVDDSVVRGTTSMKIREMVMDAGAKEVHFRIASPPTMWPCFYGVDTPQRDKLIAATMSEDEMRVHLGVDSSAIHLARRPLSRLRRRGRARPSAAAVLRRVFLRRLPGPALRHGGARVRDARSGVIPGPGTIALVTGASRGFGYAAAAALGAEGAQVIGMARTVGGLEDLADAIEAAGGPTPTLAPLSITDEPGLKRLCLAIHERWGRLDLVVHAAAHAAPLTPAQMIAAKDFDASVEVNLRGTQRLIGAVAPLLGSAGSFVQVADERAGAAFFGSYGATKGAADALARSWAAETARIGPRVLLFRPAPMPTALRGRFYPGESAAGLTPCADEARRMLGELAA